MRMRTTTATRTNTKKNPLLTFPLVFSLLCFKETLLHSLRFLWLFSDFEMQPGNRQIPLTLKKIGFLVLLSEEYGLQP